MESNLQSRSETKGADLIYQGRAAQCKPTATVTKTTGEMKRGA
jgi:hypothetical protein